MFKEYRNKAGIYKLTNSINGKVYVGKSINLFSRIQDHKYTRSKCVIDKAIKAYGWRNFLVEILEDFIFIDKIELLAIETAYIDFFKSLTTQNGYNVCIIGNDRTGFPHSEKTKLKISKTKTGTMCGSKNPFYGKVHSEETIKRMREKGKNKGAIWNKVPIKQIDMVTGDLIKTWDSAREASISIKGKISSSINHVLKGKNKSAFGFRWEYS